MDFKSFKWQSFHSKVIEFYEMTTEKTPQFKIVKMDSKTAVGWKILKLFNTMANLDNDDLKVMMRNNLSLQVLQRIKLNSGDWYFIKQNCLDLIEKLYVVKTISEANLRYMLNFVIEDVIKDLDLWCKSEESGKNSDPVFLINNNLFNLEEQHIEDTKYRPYFEKIYFMKHHSFKEYVIKSCIKFIRGLIQKPKYPKNSDYGFLKQFKSIFKKLNMMNTDHVDME
jgi:hypothetical protein